MCIIKMINKSKTNIASQKALKYFLKNNVLKQSRKIRGKFPPFSEIIDNETKILKIIKIYELEILSKNFYLLIVKNYSKHPKERYFLAIKLASQSSDLLVTLSNDFAHKNSLRLIQYIITPKLHRVSLISLKEIVTIEDYSLSIEILREFRNKFLNILTKVKKQLK